MFVIPSTKAGGLILPVKLNASARRDLFRRRILAIIT
jgi:hypothetical protein